MNSQLRRQVYPAGRLIQQPNIRFGLQPPGNQSFLLVTTAEPVNGLVGACTFNLEPVNQFLADTLLTTGQQERQRSIELAYAGNGSIKGDRFISKIIYYLILMLSRMFI